MVYEDVVLSPMWFDPEEDLIDLEGQYFIPAYAILDGFSVTWKEKAENSFTKLALKEVYARNKLHPKGYKVTTNLDGELINVQATFPYFATYNSKSNVLRFYFIEGIPSKDRYVLFRTYKDELVRVPFTSFEFVRNEDGYIRWRRYDTLDLRYMIAKTVSLTQKKVLSISCRAK